MRSAACAEGLLKYSATAAATAAPIDPIAAIIAPIAAEVSGFTQGGTDDTDGGGLCLARSCAQTHSPKRLRTVTAQYRAACLSGLGLPQ